MEWHHLATPLIYLLQIGILQKDKTLWLNLIILETFVDSISMLRIVQVEVDRIIPNDLCHLLIDGIPLFDIKGGPSLIEKLHEFIIMVSHPRKCLTTRISVHM